MLNERREADCCGITPERKYVMADGSYMKCSLRPSEWQVNPLASTLCIPRFGKERVLHEAASLRFIADRIDIPVPKLNACFFDDSSRNP